MRAVTACLFVLSCLILAACSSPPAEDIDEPIVDLGPAPSDLNGGMLKGTRWRLISFGPAAAQQPVMNDPQRLDFIDFDKVDQRLAGSTGCNRFFGRYRQIGAAGFTIGQVGMTRTACSGAAKEQEIDIIKHVKLARFFGINGQTLTIATEDGERLMFTTLAADQTASYRCDQGRLLNTTLSTITGHLSLRLPDGALEDLAPEADAVTTTYSSGLYRLQISGANAQLDDLTLHQQMRCTRQN
jgi:heat shock protein HslJ